MTYDFGSLSSSAEFFPGLSQNVPDCPGLADPDLEKKEKTFATKFTKSTKKRRNEEIVSRVVGWIELVEFAHGIFMNTVFTIFFSL